MLEAGWKEEDLQVRVTTGPGHVRSLLTERADKATEEGHWTIMVLGGDGLVHEVIATLLSLSPSCRVQIVAIPCGTGNALCHSLGTGTPQEAVSRFLSNETRPLKLSAVYVKRLAGGPLELVRPCFCVFSWGYHAQIVRQSEVLRFLGVSRFRLAAIWNLFRLFPYSCHFRTLSDSYMEPRIFKYFLATRVCFLLEHYRDFYSRKRERREQMTHLQKGFQIAPSANLSEKHLTLISTQNVSRLQMARFLKSVEDGKPIDDSNQFGFVQTLKTEGFVLRPEPKSGRWRGWLDWTRVHDICIDGEMEEIDNGAEIWVKPWDDTEERVSFVV